MMFEEYVSQARQALSGKGSCCCGLFRGQTTWLSSFSATKWRQRLDDELWRACRDRLADGTSFRTRCSYEAFRRYECAVDLRVWDTFKE